MSTETNWSKMENWSRTTDFPTELCHRMGATHKAYGWAPVPDGGWTAEQIAAYRLGYEGKDITE